MDHDFLSDLLSPQGKTKYTYRQQADGFAICAERRFLICHVERMEKQFKIGESRNQWGP